MQRLKGNAGCRVSRSWRLSFVGSDTSSKFGRFHWIEMELVRVVQSISKWSLQDLTVGPHHDISWNLAIFLWPNMHMSICKDMASMHLLSSNSFLSVLAFLTFFLFSLFGGKRGQSESYSICLIQHKPPLWVSFRSPIYLHQMTCVCWIFLQTSLSKTGMRCGWTQPGSYALLSTIPTFGHRQRGPMVSP